MIARNSSFVYKGKAVDVRQIARELGVRYLLEGGVRKFGARLRITAQLIEAEMGAHLWADKMQRALAYGSPGFGETPDRDAKEVFYSLALAAPICVLGGDDPDQPAEASIRQMQIAFINIPFDRTLPGHRVRITGTLFHAIIGHHHTKVLISPARIERQ